jgi:hypothetical protein
MHESGHARGRRGGSLLEQPVRTTCKPPPRRRGALIRLAERDATYRIVAARAARTPSSDPRHKFFAGSSTVDSTRVPE